MSYSAEISRNNPTALIFLLDQSGSMADPFGGNDESALRKADFLADVVNRTLYDLVLRCAKSDDVRDYYHIAVVGYGAVVQYALGGALTGRDIVPISEVARNPIRVEQRQKKIPDGAGGLVEQSIKFPVWAEPTAEGGTPMCQALKFVESLVAAWTTDPAHRNAFPPTVLHITDGESTDGDPAEIARGLSTLGTSDGKALVFNCHISSDRSAKIEYPTSAEGLGNNFAKTLFGISSELPSQFVNAGKQVGLAMSPGARGFVFNADATSLVQFFEIGTRPSNMR